MMPLEDLKDLIRECIQETLEERAALKEAVKGPGYAIKAWANKVDLKGTPAFDSQKSGKLYPDYDAVLKALATSELSELGAYEIMWIPSGTEEE